MPYTLQEELMFPMIAENNYDPITLFTTINQLLNLGQSITSWTKYLPLDLRNLQYSLTTKFPPQEQLLSQMLIPTSIDLAINLQKCQNSPLFQIRNLINLWIKVSLPSTVLTQFPLHLTVCFTLSERSLTCLLKLDVFQNPSKLQL